MSRPMLRLLAVLALVLAWLGAPAPAAAQSLVSAPDTARAPESFVHESWTVADGRPVKSVTALLQSRDGYLWIATFDGLVRFDGGQREVHQGERGLPAHLRRTQRRRDRELGKQQDRSGTSPAPAAPWICGGVGYAPGFARLGARLERRRGRVTQALAAAGQRSLSADLFASAGVAMLLHTDLVGLGDHVHRAGAMAIAAGVWVVGVLLARGLDIAGRRGPADALLRRLVYGRPACALYRAAPG